MPACALCNESMGDETSAEDTTPAHRACVLRSVMGGIGHLIAHDYWCTQYHDPDAGLTYRQSALLVDEFVHLVGAEETVRRGIPNPHPNLVDGGTDWMGSTRDEWNDD